MEARAETWATRGGGARRLVAWAALGVAAASACVVLVMDADAGSLNLGKFQAAALIAAFLVASTARAVATDRTAELAGDLLRVGAVSLQLFLLAVAVSAFQIENPAFYGIIVPLAFGGFLVHHALPDGWRQPFFVVLSWGAIALVFGLADAAWLVGLGLVLILICHLPAAWWTRVLLLLTVGGGYAWLRTGPVSTPWSVAIWPILGSMFMFRLIAYAYHLKHAKERPNGWRVLAYFFLLPNVSFPLFPVVDFKTFQRTYYHRDEYAIYQRGVQWMLLGLVHLLAYRLVYHHVVLPEAEVRDAVTLARQITGTFLLYLKVSGQFHFIVGMLHLFGYALPETHRFFFLSSSFNDLWRRINIYWKDFMMKTFYYPSVFFAKRWGTPIAIAFGTVLCVFFLNWVFHAYQWFWILGVTPISATDTLFWVVLGAAMVWNGLWELRRGRKRSLAESTRLAPRAAFLKALRTAAFFLVFSTLWSIWTTASFEQWLLLVDVDVTATDVLVLATAVAVAVLGLTVFYARAFGLVEGSARAAGSFRFAHAGAGASVAAVLLLCASPATFSGASPSVQRFAQSLRVDELNRADAELLARGYYEQLTGVNRFNGELWSVYAARGTVWEPFGAEMIVESGDYLRHRMVPLFGELTPGGWLTTNSFGMNDREYDREPPPGVYRVALLGASYVANVKVGDGNGFEAVAEARLAAERARSEQRPIEVLNFAVPSYTHLQQLFFLDDVEAFEPDIVLFGTHHRDENQGLTHVSWLARNPEVEVPERYRGYLDDLFARAEVDASMSDEVVRDRLRPFTDELQGWVYRRFVERCREMGVEAVWLAVPMAEAPDRQVVEEMRAMADSAGFRTYDLTDAFEGEDVDDLAIREWDRHVNVAGNRILAGPFAEVLRRLEAEASETD